jgi:hypothetical protein
MNEPLLATMTINDLNQRYAESFVFYDGGVHYIREFFPDGPKVKMYVTNPDPYQDNLTFDFVWTALETTRPKSRWYPDGNGSFLYLAYLPQRQYSRGICRNNTVVYDAFGKQSAVSRKAVEIIFKEPQPILRYTKEEVAFKTTLLLSEQLFCGPDSIVRFRTIPIGVRRAGRFELTRTDFFQDFRDIGLGDCVEYGLTT